jgi:hypothetical protein
MFVLMSYLFYCDILLFAISRADIKRRHPKFAVKGIILFFSVYT